MLWNIPPEKVRNCLNQLCKSVSYLPFIRLPGWDNFQAKKVTFNTPKNARFFLNAHLETAFALPLLSHLTPGWGCRGGVPGWGWVGQLRPMGTLDPWQQPPLLACPTPFRERGFEEDLLWKAQIWAGACLLSAGSWARSSGWQPCW